MDLWLRPWNIGKSLIQFLIYLLQRWALPHPSPLSIISANIMVRINHSIPFLDLQKGLGWVGESG